MAIEGRTNDLRRRTSTSIIGPKSTLWSFASTSRVRLRPGAFALVWHLLMDTGGSAVQISQAFGVEKEFRRFLLTLSGKAKTAPMPVAFIHGLPAP